jgi:hypothetical protein
MVDIIAVSPAKITAGEAEVMDGVKQVGLANAVFAADTIDPAIELKTLFSIIFKLE